MDKLKRVLSGRDAEEPGGLAELSAVGTKKKRRLFHKLGNIASIGSTLFLMGPMQQLKRMFDPTCLIATVVMLLCLMLTLCSAFWVQRFLHTICKVLKSEEEDDT